MGLIVNRDAKEKILSLLYLHSENEETKIIRYVDLGVQRIRLIIKAEEAVSTIENQFGTNLIDTSDKYDSTIVIWKEERESSLSLQVLNCLSSKERMAVRAESLWLKNKDLNIKLLEESREGVQPFLHINGQDGLAEAIDRDNGTAFFSYWTFEPEIFVKEGHAFVRIINALVKNDTTNLTHGAVFGKNGNGILLCGRGKRGKSTLTIESMLRGFDFVSDDYQIIEKSGEELLAYPVYSIITVSHSMYNKIKNRFNGRFLCKNWTKEKFLFNIDCYCEQFKKAYPIKLCLFPEIVRDEHPGIVLCNRYEKGRAIVQLIHSTVSQMDDMGDEAAIQKLFCMVKDMPFYKFNLCSNITENTEYLNKRLKTISYEEAEAVNVDCVLLDVSFGLATILDTGCSRFICLNKSATNLLLMLLCGKSKADIINCIKEYENENETIVREFLTFYEVINRRFPSLLKDDSYGPVEFNPEYLRKSDFRLSMREFKYGNTIELVK